MSDDSMNSSQNLQKKGTQKSDNFLNAHPVVRLVKSHEVVLQTQSSPSSSNHSTVLSERNKNQLTCAHLTTSRWYNKNVASNQTLHSPLSNCSSEASYSPSIYSPDGEFSQSPRNLERPQIPPQSLSVSNSPDWRSTIFRFEPEKSAARTKSTGSSASSRFRIGGLSLRKIDNFPKKGKNLSLRRLHSPHKSKRKTGLETELNALKEFARELNSGLNSPDELIDYASYKFINLDVSASELEALRLVVNLDLFFVADVLVPKSKYFNRLAFRKLKRKSSVKSARDAPRNSITTSQSVIAGENDSGFGPMRSECTWRCVASSSNEKELFDKLNTSDVIAVHSKCTNQNSQMQRTPAHTWVHKSGQCSLEIPDTPLFQLTEAEVVTLQKLAVICLRATDFSCNIIIPREFPLETTKRFSSNSGGLNSRFCNLRKSSRNSSETQSRLFGVSLGSLVRNQDKENFPEPSVEPPSPDNPNPSEQDPTPTKETDNFIDRKDTKTMADAEKEHIEKLKSYLTNDHPETLGKAVFISSSIGNIAAPQSFAVRKMSQVALDSSPTGGGGVACGVDFRGRGPSFSSIYSILARSASSLVDALTLSPHETNSTHNSLESSSHRSRKSASQSESVKYAVPNEPCVPIFVKTCVSWIKQHDGLKTLGIFRIAGSQKRIKNLRECFDTLGDTHWPNEESATVHDVAALLKSFLRELPEGLLSRELYHPLIATTKIEDVKVRLKCLKLLLCLLPRASRDTLHFLLSFLHEIHSATLSEEEEEEHEHQQHDPNSSPEMSGSKMNAANLATVFGPTIMKPPNCSPCGHRSGGITSNTASLMFLGGGAGDIGVEKMEYIEDYSPIVKITKTLILCHQQLFQLDGATTSNILQVIQETNPEAVDFIINQRYSKSFLKRQISVDQTRSSTKEPKEATHSSIFKSSSQKRANHHNSSRSLSCCRHSIKQARERFFQDPTTAFNPNLTPLSYQDHYRKFSQLDNQSGFAEVGTYTRKFRSNKISRGYQF